MKTMLSAILLILLATWTGAVAETTKVRPNLPDKPEHLALMKLPGIDVVTSKTFVTFTIVDVGKIDVDLLKKTAESCQAGKGCGDAMSAGAVDDFYKQLESMTWEYEVLADRLIGVVEGNRPMIFGRIADQVGLSANVLSARLRCLEGSGQPQCPPQPPSPRDEWLGRLGVVLAQLVR